MKTILPFIFFLFAVSGIASAQAASAKKSKTQTVVIHTSANCGECKTTIETALNKVKGIKSVILDLETKDATVVFSPKKLDVAGVKKAISMSGYDADELKANQEAHDNLPACCRKGGHE